MSDQNTHNQKQKSADSKRDALLKQRSIIKAKKPNFVMQDAHKKKRLKQKWRNPRGIDSKMRLHLKGYRTPVSKGWKSPAAVRGLTSAGMRPVMVATIQELGALNPKTDIAVIRSAVGKRVRVLIAIKAQELGIAVRNIKDLAGFVKKVQDDLGTRKIKKGERTKEKEKKQKEKEKVASAKEAKEKKEKESAGSGDSKDMGEATTHSDETKEEHDKKELDKLLINKQ